ncbi:MAG: dihydroorotate dehydrogenase electron transfer subunit [Lachnospiraceae bacterium]|uniref:dihydroorotate dehydrogenase electron transfer subunit n=1 Tax=Candidatus Merdisoma sp. JLR.KK006 TaxID=3112626 RepID=UPI002FEF8C64|nr:dihydroorotate dehydrogenase electron transfer subunit [Lachnospiraceae bacterium]
MKYRETAVITEQQKIATDIYSMWLQTERIAGEAVPGQFLSVYSRDESRMLPRPISICQVDQRRGRIRLVYRIAGKGTKEFSGYGTGDTLEIVGPLGNGFPLDKGYEKVLLIGGGIGIPPMVELSERLSGEKLIVVGYRNSELFLKEELERNGELYLASEDGSVGTKGNVLDAIHGKKLSGQAIFACGPTPMLRALKTYAAEQGIDCYLSLEERMACGVGACLACVCHSMDIDAHTHVKNKRICKDGPVFAAGEIEL